MVKTTDFADALGLPPATAVGIVTDAISVLCHTVKTLSDENPARAIVYLIAAACLIANLASGDKVLAAKFLHHLIDVCLKDEYKSQR